MLRCSSIKDKLVIIGHTYIIQHLYKHMFKCSGINTADSPRTHIHGCINYAGSTRSFRSCILTFGLRSVGHQEANKFTCITSTFRKRPTHVLIHVVVIMIVHRDYFIVCCQSRTITIAINIRSSSDNHFIKNHYQTIHINDQSWLILDDINH